MHNILRCKNHFVVFSAFIFKIKSYHHFRVIMGRFIPFPSRRNADCCCPARATARSAYGIWRCEGIWLSIGRFCRFGKLCSAIADTILRRRPPIRPLVSGPPTVFNRHVFSSFFLVCCKILGDRARFLIGIFHF